MLWAFVNVNCMLWSVLSLNLTIGNTVFQRLRHVMNTVSCVNTQKVCSSSHVHHMRVVYEEDFCSDSSNEVVMKISSTKRKRC